MAIIVRHKQTGVDYILVGTGFGAYKSSRPDTVLGQLSPVEDYGEMEMVAVCDSEGRLFWARSQDVYVVEVDGQTPSDVLRESDRRLSPQKPPKVSGEARASNEVIEAILDGDDTALRSNVR